MRVFTTFDPTQASTIEGQKRTYKKRKTSAPVTPGEERSVIHHAKPRFDESAVRAKIERAKQKKNVVETQKQATPEASTQAKEEAKVEKKGEDKGDHVKLEGHILNSDVKNNNPKDPHVQEKLKDVLKMGAFNFNEKEKKALAEILNKSQ